MASLLAVDVMNLVVSSEQCTCIMNCFELVDPSLTMASAGAAWMHSRLCQKYSYCQACCHCHCEHPPANLQTNGAVRPIVRKKAALCLLRLLRKAGPDSDMLAADAWSVKLVSMQPHLLWLGCNKVQLARL